METANVGRKSWGALWRGAVRMFVGRAGLLRGHGSREHSTRQDEWRCHWNSNVTDGILPTLQPLFQGFSNTLSFSTQSNPLM